MASKWKTGGPKKAKKPARNSWKSNTKPKSTGWRNND